MWRKKRFRGVRDGHCSAYCFCMNPLGNLFYLTISKLCVAYIVPLTKYTLRALIMIISTNKSSGTR